MFVCPSVRSVDFNMLRSGGNLHPTPLPTVLIAPKAPVPDVTCNIGRRLYLSYLSVIFAPKALLSKLPLCHFSAESASI